MTENEWVDFALRGYPWLASVGRLDPELCRLLGCSTNLVRIRHDYALKLLHKHRYQPHTLPLMEHCLQFGRVVADKKWHLSFFHYDEVVIGGWHQLTIKTADNGSEVWVSTFHPQSPSEVHRLTKKHTVIRNEKHNGQP